MSERLTASALWPSLRGSAPARKCAAFDSMSVDTASSMPAPARSSAAVVAHAQHGAARRAGRSTSRSVRIRRAQPSDRLVGPARFPRRATRTASFSSTPLTNLWPSVPPKLLPSSIASLSTTLKGVSGRSAAPRRRSAGSRAPPGDSSPRLRSRCGAMLCSRASVRPTTPRDSSAANCWSQRVPVLRACARTRAASPPGSCHCVERLQRDLARAVPRRALAFFTRHLLRQRPGAGCAISTATRTASAPLSGARAAPAPRCRW